MIYGSTVQVGETSIIALLVIAGSCLDNRLSTVELGSHYLMMRECVSIRKLPIKNNNNNNK